MRRAVPSWWLQPEYVRGYGVSYPDELAQDLGLEWCAELIDASVEVPQDAWRPVRPEAEPARVKRSWWVTGVLRRELISRVVPRERAGAARAWFASLASGAFAWPGAKLPPQQEHARIERVLVTDAPEGALQAVRLPPVSLWGPRATYEVRRVPEDAPLEQALARELLACERDIVRDMAERYPRDVVIAQAVPGVPLGANVLTLIPHLKITRGPERALHRNRAHRDVAWALRPGVLPAKGEPGRPSERTPLRLVRDRDGLAFVWTVADSVVRPAPPPTTNLLTFRSSAAGARVEDARALADWTAWVAPEVAWLRGAGRSNVRAPWPLQAMEALLVAGLGDIVPLQARLETVLSERGLIAP